MAAFNNSSVMVKVLQPAPAGKTGDYYWGLVSDAAPKDLFKMSVTADTSIGTLKASIEKDKGYPAKAQRMLYFGSELDDTRTLGSCGFNNTDDPLLHLIPNP
uniref:Ubiquitin-like domain-containing protein n=1 Tax=Alexandrium andersonii TaxID=327968 RepID=A0A7S2DNL9_9DINO|mmetsp:Transcript_56771/g.127814  ORF Transcript_56771/g.127814 Transcript_56771/m.127814 type:complete len:102 (+) Transcript_56771:73-378(+)